jgi:hypothetical protein
MLVVLEKVLMREVELRQGSPCGPRPASPTVLAKVLLHEVELH